MDEKALYDVSYGLYVVGTTVENMPTGCIVNTVFQITSSPIKIGVSINYDNYTNSCIQNTREFSVSILSENTPKDIFSIFGFSSGKTTDKFANVKYKRIMNNLPVLTEGVTGWLHCKVENIVDVGSHAIFIAEVIDSEKVSDEPAMTYEYYHKTMKAKAPKNAPTYRGDDATNKPTGKKFVCSICGYEIDAEEFINLPDDWKCPICGAGKDKFFPN